MEWSQTNRPFRINTPLGPDVLLLESWEGEEAISSLFHFTVRAWSSRYDIQPSELLLKDVSLDITLPDGITRKICGVVSRFVRGGTIADEHMSYLLEIVPPHWTLTLDSGFDIFQQKSARDACDKVLSGTAHEWKLVRTLMPRPYCFRYRESSWTFVSRLLEQEGIWYRFSHDGGQATLIMGDNTASAREEWGVDELQYQPDNVGLGYNRPRVTELRVESNPYPAQSRIRNASEFLPNNNLAASTEGASQIYSPPSEMVRYDFEQQLTAHHSGIDHSGGDTPGDTGELPTDVKTYSRIRQEQYESSAMLYQGKSGYAGLQTGARATIKGRDEAGLNGPVFITRVVHSGSNGSYRVDGDPSLYSNTFEAIPASTQYRPPRITPWPRVAGAHVGTVTGPEGEEIYTDKHGRVQVVFKWDTDNKVNLERSCWIRVAQPFAGQQFGAVFLPRIGHEVIVSFLDGNPDNPVVSGSLYNSANMPPWKLPDNKTQSGVRTRSTLNGGADNFNQMRFEDLKGEEQIHVQAEKDLDTLVKNDETRNVEHDRTTNIKNNETRTVAEGFEHVTIEKGEQVIKVNSNNRTLHVEKDHGVTINGSEKISVRKDRSVAVGGNQSHKVAGDDALTVSGKQKVTISGDQETEVSRGDYSMLATSGKLSITAKAGKVLIDAKANEVLISAMMSITLSVGSSSIVIDQSGITIKGIAVKVEGLALAEVKAPATRVNGDGMVQVRGGITMIN